MEGVILRLTAKCIGVGRAFGIRRRKTMKWSGNTDYHGSRIYALDPPPKERRSTGKMWTRLALAARRLAERLRSRSSAVPATVVLVHGRERHFSLLGAKLPAIGISGSRAVDWPFPLQKRSGGRVHLRPHDNES
jgi:hypothetical protein